MPSAKQLAAFAVGVLALVLLVWAVRSRRAPVARPVARPRPAPVVAPPAPEAVDAGPVADVAAVDVAVVAVDVPPPRPLTPAQRAAANQRRDAVAAQVFRDLAQHDHPVEAVQAVEGNPGLRDTLRVRGAACNEFFTRDVASGYPQLGQAGFALVTCVRPDTRDTYQTGVSSQ